MLYAAISRVDMEEWEKWEEIMANAEIQETMNELITNTQMHPKYQLKEASPAQKLFKNSLNSSRIPHLSYGGRVFRSLKRIGGVFYWASMMKTIKTFIAECHTCQTNKYQTLAPSRLLQPLPIPTQVWSDISMDFILGLPITQGKDTILVMVDRLMKYMHFISLSQLFLAKEVAKIFILEVVRLHGFPTSIVTDRERLFLSQFW
ncbi:Tf2-6, partial [Mucuna pruriens]